MSVYILFFTDMFVTLLTVITVVKRKGCSELPKISNMYRVLLNAHAITANLNGFYTLFTSFTEVLTSFLQVISREDLCPVHGPSQS